MIDFRKMDHDTKEMVSLMGSKETTFKFNENLQNDRINGLNGVLSSASHDEITELSVTKKANNNDTVLSDYRDKKSPLPIVI